MAPALVHLPNGQTLTVSPVFGGLFFKSHDQSSLHSIFPTGWTIVIHTEDDEDDHHPTDRLAPSYAAPRQPPDERSEISDVADPLPKKEHHIHRYRRPSLRSDRLFISSISNPSSQDFKPATSQTRAIAMMLWATLYWYFHQPEPEPQLDTSPNFGIPIEARPKADWRVYINREGILKGKHLLPKLERMGLIASEDSSVGLDPEDGVANTGEGWTNMFVSRRNFWQLDARIYLFTLTPTITNSPYPTLSPASSRPASPDRRSLTPRSEDQQVPLGILGVPVSGSAAAAPAASRHSTPTGPFTSNSHLPTFYPPPPPQYTFTNGVRHPIRPKPPRQGEIFYTRYIPSLGQYLSFRVASLSGRACPHRGPTSFTPDPPSLSTAVRDSLRLDSAAPAAIGSTRPSSNPNPETSSDPSDLDLLHKWMNDPRVAASWGEAGPRTRQKALLSHALGSRHSFPVIGSFDGQPFGYFEIYWVREDALAAHTTTTAPCGLWDRGLHVLVGEHAFRGPHRVAVWLSALLHYCWLADDRTENVFMEPRVDNEKILKYCLEAGFHKEREIALPHKQANLLRISREAWEAPAI